MDDLMGKIQEVLSDEESMKQLSELAASLFPSSEQNGTEDGCSDETEANEDKEDDSSKQGIDFDLSKLLMIGQVMRAQSSWRSGSAISLGRSISIWSCLPFVPY